MLVAARLPLRFDPHRLKHDLARIEDSAWVEHFNKANYEGKWSIAALTAPAGATHPIQEAYPDPMATEFVPTSLLARCHYFQEVIESLLCEKRSVRLLRLDAGSSILPHKDLDLSLDDEQVRLHIPIASSDRIRFEVDGQQIPMHEGDVWYMNANLRHGVQNYSDTSRIHLVLDCVVNTWLRNQIANGEKIEEPSTLQRVARVNGGCDEPVSGSHGSLGLAHLKHIWASAMAARQGNQINDAGSLHLDRLVTDSLGLGLEQTMQYLFQTAPTFEEFERWVIATAGRPDPETVARINAIVTNTAYSETIQGWLDAVETGAPVLSDRDLAFWNEQGYVVVPGAAHTDCIAAAAAAIWDFVGGNPGDPDSWYGNRDPGIMLQLVQHPAFSRIRRSQRIHKAFAQLWNTPDLVVSADRCGFNAPEREGWAFSGPDLHWDLDLAQPVPFGTQGILYLTDTPAEQGAFTLVPGFHKRIGKWLKQLPPDQDPQQGDLHALGSHPVAGRVGDLIIWHQALPHGSRPNTGQQPRLVLYVNMYPARP